MSNAEVPTEALSIGQITGGISPFTPVWNAALTRLTKRVVTARKGVESPLLVNVICHVPGHILQPDFEGIRTGYSSKKHRALIVQVALPEEPPTLDADELDAYLKQTMLDAIREAESWAIKRKRASDLHA